MKNFKKIRQAGLWVDIWVCQWVLVPVVQWVFRVRQLWVCRYRVLSLRWLVYWWCQRQWRRWFPVLQVVYEWVLILGVLAFLVYGFLAQWFGWVAPVPVRPVPHW